MAKKGVDINSNNFVSFVGTLSTAWNFSTIYNLACISKEKNYDFKFVICGNGESLEKLKFQFKDLDNVIFPGWIDLPKIKSLYKASIAILSPYRESKHFSNSLPNKIIDSFAAGRPVITSLKGSVKDLIENQKIGISSNDSNLIMKYLLKLKSNNEFRNAVFKKSREVYKQNFEYEKIYGSIVNDLINLSE